MYNKSKNNKRFMQYIAAKEGKRDKQLPARVSTSELEQITQKYNEYKEANNITWRFTRSDFIRMTIFKALGIPSQYNSNSNDEN